MVTEGTNALWWSQWAPYWDQLEDRHLGTLIAESFADSILGPVLVVGGGQGVVIEHLRKKGLEVHGVDLEPRMIALARERRGIRMIRANATSLPFEDGAFRTVIIATGIVDYMSDEGMIRAVFAEALRVTRNNGDLIVTFYKMDSRLEGINRRLGVISKDGCYHLKRIFDIIRTYKKGRFLPVGKIAAWAGKGFLSTFFYWGYLGVTLPASMRREQRNIARIFERAAADGVDVERLYDTIPEGIPYRGPSEIRRLVDGCGIPRYTLDTHPDCVVVRHHKFGFVDVRESDGEDRPAGEWVIRTRSLKKSYGNNGTLAVDDVSIEIEKGTIFGILGPNGAGKTTTLSMLSDLVTPTAGQVEFSSLKKSEIKRHLGYVPQELALYERLTARDNLKFFGRLYDLPAARLNRRIEELLELTSLSKRADEPISGFSQGMLRRLNLATGLIHEPAIVLMDEPTVGIDPQSRNRIYDAIFKLKAEGATILYTTHYMDEARHLCDRIAIMDHGKVILNEEPGRAVKKYGLFRMAFHCQGGNQKPLIREIKGFDHVESASVEDEVLRVLTSAGQESTETIKRIEEASKRHQVTLSLKRVVEPSLESLFLDITGREIRDRGGY